MGRVKDPDDMTIAHEYGHFVMDQYSADDSPGGDHDPWGVSTPALAWSEGWATFFAGMVLDQNYFVNADERETNTYFSIETVGEDIPFGMTKNRIDGNLSEVVVSAVLWDLYDSVNETADTLSNKGYAIWKVLTSYLNKGEDFKDRGYPGVDLVDFLDGWFYLGYGHKGSEEVGMIANVWILHQLLGYDFAIKPKGYK